MKDKLEMTLVAEAQLEFLQVLWASKNPLSPKQMLAAINKLRVEADRPKVESSTVRVTLSKLRVKGLIALCRPDEQGFWQVVSEDQVSDRLQLKDNKNGYRAAIESSQVRLKHAAKPNTTPMTMSDAWAEHAENIRSKLKEFLFDEPMTLADLYVEPLAYVVVPQANKDLEVRRVVNLMEDMLKWGTTDDVDYPVRILSGDAGCGKSSFAKVFAWQLVKANIPVALVPLHELVVSISPRDALVKAASKLKLPKDILDPAGQKNQLTVIILDGLDELAKQGDGGERAAKVFARGVQQAVNDCNNKGRKLRVLLCGRPIVAKEASDSFQNQQQSFHLIPYLPQDMNNKAVEYRDLDVKKHDQRQQWWSKYSQTYNRCATREADEPTVLPDLFREKKLIDFTAQPLLLFLLAITYRGRKKVHEPFSQQVPPNPFQNDTLPERLADVYAWLLGQVYLRENERKAYGFHEERKEADKLTYEEFRKLMGVLGLAAWHSVTARVATICAVEQLCDLLGLKETLDKYTGLYKTGTLSLFVAFYFKQSSKLADTTETFEFTIKPFAEYLAAVGLVTLLEDCNELLGARKTRGGRYTERDLLLNLLQAAGPGELTQELDTNLHQEVERRVKQGENNELASKGMQVVTQLINDWQRNSFPVEDIRPTLSYQRMTVLARSSSHVLLQLHSTCRLASVDWSTKPERSASDDFQVQNQWRNAVLEWSQQQRKSLSQPTWSGETSLRDAIHSINCGIQSGNVNHKTFSFSFLELSRVDLTGANLGGAYLDGANLFGASLTGANLFGANLERANLSEANLIEANLIEANLIGANLDWAILERANLGWANLYGANLERANLDGAILHGANLEGANLEEANLEEVNLHGAMAGDIKLDTPEGREYLLSKGAILD